MCDKCDPEFCKNNPTCSNKNCNKSNCQKEIINSLKSNVKEDIKAELKLVKENLKDSCTVYNFLFGLTQMFVSLLLGIAWIAGFVIAKGFWSTFFCIIPFYSWYLIIDLVLEHYGI